jgi:aminopeptidase N
MSSFTVIRETYGREVRANEHAIWLGAHELSHQWWGNMVTCSDWTHFWLNEGMANFMTAAYLEHRFGRQEYLRQIEEYRASYQKVRAAGEDRSLVFPDWLHPTAHDRTLVYDKGAYVLHLLRQELGERAFWAGIRSYTRKYFGKSVTTAAFQTAMEQASGKNLTDFFAKWIYLKTKDEDEGGRMNCSRADSTPFGGDSVRTGSGSDRIKVQLGMKRCNHSVALFTGSRF